MGIDSASARRMLTQVYAGVPASDLEALRRTRTAILMLVGQREPKSGAPNADRGGLSGTEGGRPERAQDASPVERRGPGTALSRAPALVGGTRTRTRAGVTTPARRRSTPPASAVRWPRGSPEGPRHDQGPVTTHGSTSGPRLVQRFAPPISLRHSRPRYRPPVTHRSRPSPARIWATAPSESAQLTAPSLPLKRCFANQRGRVPSSAQLQPPVWRTTRSR